MLHKKILIVNDLHQSFIRLLEAQGFLVDYQPHIPRMQVEQIISSYHGLVVRSKLHVDREFLLSAKNLEFIARAGAGLDNIDEKAVKDLNIRLFNAPEGNRDAVGEHTVGMLLALFTHLTIAHEEIKRKIWQRESNRGFELKGKTVGIIGYGNTGKAVAKRLKSFECELIAYDRYPDDPDGLVEMVSLAKMQEQADVISLHIPLTETTHLMVNENFLSRFEKNIFVINTSRGKVLSLKALLSQIKKGKVRGAALDVLENERMSTLTESEEEVLDALVATHKVIFTPHVAGWTYESYEKISMVLAQKILKFYDSVSPEKMVNSANE